MRVRATEHLQDKSFDDDFFVILGPSSNSKVGTVAGMHKRPVHFSSCIAVLPIMGYHLLYLSMISVNFDRTTNIYRYFRWWDNIANRRIWPRESLTHQLRSPLSYILLTLAYTYLACSLP